MVATLPTPASARSFNVPGHDDDSCGPDCRYRQLYAGSQASLSDMASRQAAALHRIGNVRDGLIDAFKTMMPLELAAAEQQLGRRLAMADDAVLLAYLRAILARAVAAAAQAQPAPEPPRPPAVDLTSLRQALEGVGIALPAGDNPTAWAAAVREQQEQQAREAQERLVEQAARERDVREQALREQQARDAAVVEPPATTETPAADEPVPDELPTDESPTEAADVTRVVRLPAATPEPTVASAPAQDLADETVRDTTPASARLGADPTRRRTLADARSEVAQADDLGALLAALGDAEDAAGSGKTSKRRSKQRRRNKDVVTDSAPRTVGAQPVSGGAVPVSAAADHFRRIAPDIDRMAHSIALEAATPATTAPTTTTPAVPASSEAPVATITPVEAPIKVASAPRSVELAALDAEESSAIDALAALFEPAASTPTGSVSAVGNDLEELSAAFAEDIPEVVPDASTLTSVDDTAVEDVTAEPAPVESARADTVSEVDSEQPAAVAPITSPGGPAVAVPDLSVALPSKAAARRQDPKQQQFRPTLFGGGAAAGKGTRKRAAKTTRVSALRPDGDYDMPPESTDGPAAQLTPELRGRLEAAAAAPRPVFVSDLVAVVGSEEVVEAWRATAPASVRFIRPPNRHRSSRGSLVVPVGELHDAAATADGRWWMQCIMDHRASRLYELAVLLHRVGDEVVNAHIGERSVLLRLRQSRGMVGVVIALFNDLDADGATRAAVAADIQELLRDKLEILAVLTATDNLEALVGMITSEASARKWSPACSVVAGRSWEYADEANSALVHVLG